MRVPFALVVAVDLNGGIGVDGRLPWHIPEDLKYFRSITVGEEGGGLENIVIMGRKTWESLPETYRPLKRRINVVLTRQKDYALPPQVQRADSLAQALDVSRQLIETGHARDVYVIGGGQIFEEAIRHPDCRAIYLTKVGRNFACTVFFPGIPPVFHIESTRHEVASDNIPLEFVVYTRIAGATDSP